LLEKYFDDSILFKEGDSMVIPFTEEVVNSGFLDPERFLSERFIGFIDNDGNALDFSKYFGVAGHMAEPMADIFREYFCVQSRKFDKIVHPSFFKDFFHNDVDPEVEMAAIELYLQRERKEKLKEIAMNIIESRKDNFGFLTYRSPKQLLEEDFYIFLFNCSKNENFREAFGREFLLLSREAYYDIMYPFKLKNLGLEEDTDEDDFPCYRISYEDYVGDVFCAMFKDIVVQYLGRHSVETMRERTITTSAPRIYSTFYQYIANDFHIDQIPKMVWNEEEKRYIEHRYNPFLIPDSELRLKEELTSVKKLVRREDRPKYYRY